MWVPKDVDELKRVVTSGMLTESDTFDAKREVDSKTLSIAKDIAAFANYGGVILYGVAEDAHGSPQVLNPIPLEGLAEKLSNIAVTSISESPRIAAKEYWDPDHEGQGYLALVVPPSVRAPHMVTVGGDNRYYARQDQTNRAMPAGQVAELFERRRRYDIDFREEMLEFIRSQHSDLRMESGREPVRLHLLALPLISDLGLLGRAASTIRHNDARGYLSALIDHARSIQFDLRDYTNDLAYIGYEAWQFRTGGLTDDDSYVSIPGRMRGNADVDLRKNWRCHFSGRLGFFCADHTDYLEENGATRYLHADAIARLTIRYTAALQKLLRDGAYSGLVRIGCGLTKLDGIRIQLGRTVFSDEVPTYSGDAYLRTTETTVVPADGTSKVETPREIARRLLTPLFRELSNEKRDVFAQIYGEKK